ncbi:MAG: UDP-N-acetylmuramate dehydrogenase [Clostridia bacterium]|nr:UDP-N-acetylmuramate dehydrogenase [Clostridia bacterium]
MKTILDILNESGVAFRENEPLSRHTSFRIGGPARFFAEPSSRDEIVFLLRELRENDLPYFVMGNGSNLLARDEGFEGLVIMLGEKFARITNDGCSITAEAGALMSKIARTALELELTGFEFAHGIPGSFGGGVFMNAGAYGGELKDIVTEVEYIDEDLKIKTCSGSEANFVYRGSQFKDNRALVILGARVDLQKGSKAEIEEKMRDLAARRRDKQPLEFPSAGSTFKRPEGYFAAKLIEDCGLKGFSVGGAQVSEKHSGFVINTGGATFADVYELTEQVKTKVMEQYGVELEREVEIMKPFVK